MAPTGAGLSEARMGFAEFAASLSCEEPPPALSSAGQALWFDAKGLWDEAHARVQDEESPEAAWVHAYLHRKEGDARNATNWYRRARQPVATGSFEEEWSGIARALFESS